jgi:hypothetical protein
MVAQPFTKAVVFGAISTGLIVLIYVTPSPEPGFAGAAFGYNMSFFFPVVILSFIFWGLALGFYIAFLRTSPGKSPLKIISPAVLLLPFTLQAAWIVRILLLLREPI